MGSPHSSIMPGDKGKEKGLQPRVEFARLVQRRQELERDLAQLEEQIYNYEGTYLKENPYGNVVRGWAAFKDPGVQVAYEVSEEDRLFSISSATSDIPQNNSASLKS